MSTRQQGKKRLNLTRNQGIGVIIISGSVLAAILITGAALGWFGGTIAPDISAPSNKIEVSIHDRVTLENFTNRYSLTAYVYEGDLNEGFDNSSMVYHKSWIVGINGSAEDCDVYIGATVKKYVVTDYVIRLNTSISIYNNFSDFYFIASSNGRYHIAVASEPDNVTAIAYDENLNQSNWNASDIFYLNFKASNKSTSAFYPSWHPDKYNDETSYFYINVTFDNPIFADTISLTRILKSSFTVNDQDGDLSSIYEIGLNNSDYSMIFACYMVNDVYMLEFETDTSVANITSIGFYYHDNLLYNYTG
jgi:hypothetical protein